MFVELDPGTSDTPVLEEGDRITVDNTAPDIDPDEILSALDTDTRAYLQLLIGGVGKGLNNHGDDLREVFKRLEPLHRDLAAVQGAFADRREELAQLIHNYGILTDELGRQDEDLEPAGHGVQRRLRDARLRRRGHLAVRGAAARHASHHRGHAPEGRTASARCSGPRSTT